MIIICIILLLLIKGGDRCIQETLKGDKDIKQQIAVTGKRE